MIDLPKVATSENLTGFWCGYGSIKHDKQIALLQFL